MKRIFTLITCLVLLIGTSQAQSDKQHTLLLKRTADWCPNCGTWGWDFVKDALVELEDENVIFWAMHHSGDLATQTSKDVADNFSGSYQPIFYINQDDLNVSSSNATAKIDEAKETISLLNGFGALIKVGVKADMLGDEILAEATVEFVEGTDTDYNVSLFLIRDKLIANQASVGSNAEHPFILDKSFYDDAFGPLVNDGATIEDGDSFTFSKSLTSVTPHTTDIGDMKVAAIVWFEANGRYNFVNGDIQDVKLSSNINEFNGLDFQYTVIGNELYLDFPENISPQAQLSLYRIDGQPIVFDQVQKTSNSITASFDRLNTGIYILKIMDQGKSASRQIYIIE